MEALRILIIEDDLLLAEDMQEQLIEFGYLITDNVSNSKDALLSFKSRVPDLVLCDIELKGSELDGIEIANVFNSITKVPIIFLTAFGDPKTVERAKQAHPAYYLIKPCNPSQLSVALNFAIDNFVTKKAATFNQSSTYPTPSSQYFFETPDFFYVKVDNKYIRVKIADILWVKAMGSNVQIVTENMSYMLTANLSSFTNQVQHNALFRVHRSYIINVNKVTSFDGGRLFIPYQEMNEEIPIGKTYRTTFQERFPRLFSD